MLRLPKVPISRWLPAFAFSWSLSLLLLTFIYSVVYNKEVSGHNTIVRYQQRLAIDTVESALKAQLDTSASALDFLSNNPTLNQAVMAPSPDNLSALSALFAAVLNAGTSAITRIAFIDIEGRERALTWRQDGDRVGVAIDTQRDFSKDKAFIETSALQLEEHYIDDFTLRGENARPLPATRLGKLVFAGQRSAQGVVILDLDMTALFEKIHAVSARFPFEVWLLNERGEWLLKGDEHLDHSDAKPPPARIWQQMQNTPMDSFSPSPPDTQQLFTGKRLNLGSRTPVITAIGILPENIMRRILQGYVFRLAPSYTAFALILGVLTYFLVTAIIRRKVAHEIAQHNAQDFQSLLNAVPDAILIVAGDGTIRAANQQAVRLLGYNLEQLKSLHLSDLIPHRYRTGHERYRQAYLLNPRLRSMAEGRELTALRRDGSEVAVSIALSPHSDETGDHIICSLRDTSHSQSTAKELRRLRAEADERNQTKNHYMTAVAQDLQTPIKALVATIERFDLNNDVNQQIAAITAISTHGHYIQSVIDNVLELASIEAQNIRLTNDDIAVNDILSHLQVLYGERARSQGTILYNHPIVGRTYALIGDKRRLSQLLGHLLKHSLHGNQSGAIHLYVDVFPDATARQAKVVFACSNFPRSKGIGQEMPAIDLEADTDHGQNQKLALDLEVVKRLSYLMQGGLFIEYSDLGETLWVNITLKLRP